MAEVTHLSANRTTMRDHVARHPMIAFVVLTYAISWAGWFLSERIDLGVVNGFGIIFSAGPALAAVIVSAVQRPEPSGVPLRKRWRLFGIVSIIALALMAVRRTWITPEWLSVAAEANATTAYPTLMALLVDVLTAALVGLVVSGVHSRKQGVRDLLHSLDPRVRPFRWYWWVIAVGIYPAVTALAGLISAQLGLPAVPRFAGVWYLVMLDVVLTFLVFSFHGGGLEEPGWRGFALPLLQKRYSPLLSSLILAVIWAFWHWPMVPGGPLAVVTYLLLEVAPLSVLFTAAFNRTGGSLPVVILLHISINATATFLSASPLAPILWITLAVGAAIWMWRSPSKT